MSNYGNYPKPHELERLYEGLTIKDDFIFGKVMSEAANCVGMLERLTNSSIGMDVTINNEKPVKITVDGKSVRYDVYVQDSDNKMYDAEMQQQKNMLVIPRRSRYYQELMDLEYLECGADYSDLPESYVIFICTFDPFDKDLCCYEFKNICVSMPDGTYLELGDGRKILLYNTRGTVVNVSSDVKKFLDYIETGVTVDEYTRNLDNSVTMAKKNKKWRTEYMKTFCHDADVRREGREEGKKLGISQGRELSLISMVARKLRKGKTPDIIAEELDEDINKIQSICMLARKLAPEYNEDELYRLYKSNT